VKRRFFVRAGAVALLAAALGAGCGSSGGGSDRLSQSEYQAKLQSIGGDLKDAMSGASLNSAKSAEEVANAVAALRKRLANAANDIDNLSPPENAEKANDALAGALREFDEALSSLEGAVRKKDVDAARTATRRIQTAVTSARTAVTDLEAAGYDVGDFGSS
jgi:hypothetical protein